MRFITTTRQPKSLSPFVGVGDILREMDGLFGQFGSVDSSQVSNENWFNPAVDVTETTDKYLIETDLPGMREKDIELKVVDRQLTISGVREKSSEEKNEKLYRSERFFGRFERVFNLPEGCDSEKIQAQFKDGVLSVAIPKAEMRKPRTIEIKSS